MPDPFSPYSPEPGANCPLDLDLQTGDILFPRAPGAVPTAGLLEADDLAFLARHGRESMADLVSKARARASTRDQPALPAGEAIESAALKRARRAGHALVSRYGGLDLSDYQTLMFLLRILRANLPDEIGQWFHITIDELISTYGGLLRLLIGALGKDFDMRDGFFVGHCALVLRQPIGDPAGDLYVIEANITDFSHYGVSIHPYLCPNDPPGDGSNQHLMRGWANFRTGLGNKVWAARLQQLRGESGMAQRVRAELPKRAMAMLGRPYGFFDSPRFGDTDRLYCSEFINQAFLNTATALQYSDPGLALALDDRRWWKWLLDNLGNSKFANAVRTALTPKLLAVVESDPFFILTVHMLWRSQALHALYTPTGEGPYA